MSSATARGFQLDQLNKVSQLLKNILNSASEQDAITYRDGGTGWTVLQVLGHLRDYEEVFLGRFTITNEQAAGGPEPDLFNPNPDEWAAEHRYSEQNLQATFDDWTARRAATIAYLKGVADDNWQRIGVHPKRGRLMLEEQLSLFAWHDINHLEQITRILAEKKTS